MKIVEIFDVMKAKYTNWCSIQRVKKGGTNSFPNTKGYINNIIELHEKIGNYPRRQMLLNHIFLLVKNLFVNLLVSIKAVHLHYCDTGPLQ